MTIMIIIYFEKKNHETIDFSKIVSIVKLLNLFFNKCVSVCGRGKCQES